MAQAPQLPWSQPHVQGSPATAPDRYLGAGRDARMRGTRVFSTTQRSPRIHSHHRRGAIKNDPPALFSFSCKLDALPSLTLFSHAVFIHHTRISHLDDLESLSIFSEYPSIIMNQNPIGGGSSAQGAPAQGGEDYLDKGVIPLPLLRLPPSLSLSLYLSPTSPTLRDAQPWTRWKRNSAAPSTATRAATGP